MIRNEVSFQPQVIPVTIENWAQQHPPLALAQLNLQ